ncbi:hypothetical protein PLICRDRAFT_174384 [Plicaturopsis crispa FD-325 SS-3]|nr:hypothetical protein PLICRDRAFT_174384 [Plicaturopsis crispa FD-325 SS-3]
MVPLSVLPRSLLALLLASPVLSAPSTPNDPFHAIAIQVQKAPDPPICCLKPLPPLEPVEDEDVLLSFEEWKAKQFAQAKVHTKETPKDAPARSGSALGPAAGAGIGPAGEAVAEAAPADAPGPPSHPDATAANEFAISGTPNEFVSPHFRVPLTDRFNYASLDCSARVHTAHRGAKSPSAILSSKRDRYMLSPCGHSNQHVIVELCEDIRIDTVQLANFEFFSGVFKDFTVSVAKTYTTDADGWTNAGTYRAKNVRGVQSFHPPTTLRDFYRYIRIDFHSHYSNEYYCPVSLLRVYGLTHLEHWKWDLWEAESRTKREDEAAHYASPVETMAEVQKPAYIPGSSVVDPGVQDSHGHTHVSATTGGQIAPPDTVSDSVVSPPERHHDSSPSTGSVSDASSTTVAVDTKFAAEDADMPPSTDVRTPSNEHSSSESSTDHAVQRTAIDVPQETAHSIDSSPKKLVVEPSIESLSGTELLNAKTVLSPVITHGTVTSSVAHTADISQTSKLSFTESGTVLNISSTNGSSGTIRSSLSTHITASPPTAIVSSSSASAASASAIQMPIVPPPTSGGESIYRTIMNRLTALEANHTLYSRYMEEQTARTRDVLRKLGEDIGRLEGIGKAQSQLFQRTVHEWERQTRRWEMEQGELLSRVNYLADEVVLEKRLGIAQLCLLLAVLVFMGLTRGSRGESLTAHSHMPRLNSLSMREWGKRNLSFSGDWVSHLRSRSPASRGPEREPTISDLTVEFPSKEQPSPEGERLHPNDRRDDRHPMMLSPVRSRTPTSVRTPASRHLTAHHHRPVTPGSRPQIARSNSNGSPFNHSGVVGPVPRSAKRWARSAHLHEVRNHAGAGSGNTEKGRREGWLHDRESRTGRENESPVRSSTPSRSRNPAAAEERFIDISSSPPATHDAQGTSHAPRHPLYPLRLGRRPSDATEDSAWVDTDVDGSELEMSVGSISPVKEVGRMDF